MSVQRLRTDYHFAILTLFGVLGVLGIGPFAIYRLVRGEWLAAVVDSALVLGLCANMAYIWRGGSTERAAVVTSITNTAGCAFIAMHIGLPGVLWAYPALVANFLIVPRGMALLSAGLLVALVAGGAEALDSGIARAVFVVTSALISLFAYIFAHRTQSQRLRLEALAIHDALTGLHNRHAMEQELARAAETFPRHQLPVALAVIDIDHFKRVNDAYGHKTGDQLLVQFADLLQSRCRASDRIFRYGGEEFVLLLPGTDGAVLADLLEALRTTVEARLQVHGEAITVSIGAAVLKPNEAVAQWLARADAAMYRAKRLGRNHAVVAESLESGPRVPA
ncbi:MAG TPA: GGDEF domain-containing protein [Lysobacter sp.]|nr:GGDEF domain-containing protein [Lysobacter sp.]